MLAQLCCRRHVARAETAALTCLAAAVLAFATMPSFLSMSAWRVLLVAGCTALLVLHDWPCLALRRASRPNPVSATTAPTGAPPSPPPSPRGDDGQTCGSCKKDFGPGRGFRVHLGMRPSCKVAHFARLCAGPVAPAPPPTSAVSEEARRSLHKGFMKTAVSDSLAALRINKLVGGTTVGDVKDAVRDWLGLLDTELRRKLCSREHSAQETAAVISARCWRMRAQQPPRTCQVAEGGSQQLARTNGNRLVQSRGEARRSECPMRRAVAGHTYRQELRRRSRNRPIAPRLGATY